MDELLWIWQKKSNNIHDLNGHIWDQWADENGSIGKAYGYQLGVKHHYPEGDMDQVDRVLYDLKHHPASRRILTNIYNFSDLSEMNLYPCAYSMTFNVSGNALNAILNQRSQDMLAAQQLERGAVRGAGPHVCPGQRPGGRASLFTSSPTPISMTGTYPLSKKFWSRRLPPRQNSLWIPPSRIFTALPVTVFLWTAIPQPLPGERFPLRCKEPLP